MSVFSAADAISAPGFWLDRPDHRAWLLADARRQFDFFRAALNPVGGFHVLDYDGAPQHGAPQELHATTRMIHSYALGHLAGAPDCEAMIDQGIAYLADGHHDADHGGWVWAMNEAGQISDGRKLAYGHVFVLLAASSAHAAGHPDAGTLIDEVSDVLDRHFWEDGPGLFCDEWNRDWTPFSTYRGMNANMHGVEALLAAYEATGRPIYLERAGRILDFFMRRMAPAENWRLPEHYTRDWQIDRGYSENPMFRPAGTTPGHSFELSRLLLHHWDLAGRHAHDDAPMIARQVANQAMRDGWDADHGGLVYTLGHDGEPDIRARYWWPVTEAIGVKATLLKHDRSPDDEADYRRLWQFADTHFIDHARGGWFPEIDASGAPAQTQFTGKPDIYHALQATLFPLTQGMSGYYHDLRGLMR